jgi:hypothetical protein
MVALFRFSIWRLDVVVNMRKILNFLKSCLLPKDPYPWGIYETSLMNVPPEILRELEDMVDSRRKDLLAAQKGLHYE